MNIPTNFKKHSWLPAHFKQSDMLLIVYALITLPVVRAFDYTTGDDIHATPKSLLTAEAFMPLSWWGTCFWVGAIILAYGVWSRRHVVVYIGHSILAVVYTALAVGMVLSILDNPWFDGIRNVSVLVLPIILHWLNWWRTGPTPITLSSEAIGDGSK